MAKELPYLSTYKNVPDLFDRIEKAKVPDAFTTRFLTDTIGLKGSNDRNLISILKKLGFLDNSGKPTSEYSRLKNKATARVAIADGVRRAYAPLYEADEKAHELSAEELKGLVAQVSGTEEAMTRLIAGTYNALVKLADFESPVPAAAEKSQDETNTISGSKPPALSQDKPPGVTQTGQAKFSPEFRFSIEIHLPSNGTEETYLAIFNALRTALG